MKIGILTLQGASNYGAVLQVLGLSEYLKSKGHEVEVIDYYTPEVYGYYDYRVFSKSITLRSVVSKAVRYRQNRAEVQAFNEFRGSYLEFSDRCSDAKTLGLVCNNYEAVICGSDQIWNPIANGGHNPEYYFGPVDGSKVKKIAYAASYGSVSKANGLESQISHWLADFTAVSVRESEAVEFLEPLIHGSVERVIDPSMLLDASDYRIFEKPINAPARYLLTYMLGTNEDMAEAAVAASRKLGLTMVCLGRKIADGQFIKNIGPGEFLYLFHHAEAVITSSFHGTAFSLLYGKPFVTFGNGGYNSRMETLLDAVGQLDRFISIEADLEALMASLSSSPAPEFSAAAAGERQRAAKFLDEALK